LPSAGNTAARRPVRPLLDRLRASPFEKRTSFAMPVCLLVIARPPQALRSLPNCLRRLARNYSWTNHTSPRPLPLPSSIVSIPPKDKARRKRARERWYVVYADHTPPLAAPESQQGTRYSPHKILSICHCPFCLDLSEVRTLGPAVWRAAQIKWWKLAQEQWRWVILVHGSANGARPSRFLIQGVFSFDVSGCSRRPKFPPLSAFALIMILFSYPTSFFSA